MQWWSWVVLWSGLVVVLLVVLAACILRVYRKATAAAAELATLESLRAELAERAETLASAAPRRQNAIVRGRPDVLAERRSIERRRALRRQRRAERRRVRGEALVRADARTFATFVEDAAARHARGVHSSNGGSDRDPRQPRE